jgi:hypothetical protein
MSNKTPYQNPEETSCIPTGVNECNVITLFQMGVECNVTQPSFPEAADGIASLVITGGTPPYFILWDNGNVGPTIFNLSAGSYEATVIDYYGDFSANTTCVLTGVTTTTSTTSTTTTSPYPNEYELCMVTNMLVQGSYVETQTHFNPNGIYDGKPMWISDDSQQSIIWDNTNSQWMVSAATPTLYVISNLNPTYPPIYGSWFLIGATGSVIVYEGLCQTSPVGLQQLRTIGTTTPLTMKVTSNQTICGCDGGLTITANGGTPPYRYSIDSGMTDKSIPFFTNLCSGSYNVVVTDNNGVITSSNVILNSPSKPTTYVVSLNTTSEITENSSTSVGKTYTTTLSVTPSLPDGVGISFDLTHLNLTKISPNENSAEIRTETVLNYNGEYFYPDTNGTNNETNSTKVGCQNETVYITSTVDSWTKKRSLYYDNQTNFVITTNTIIIKNEDNNCYLVSSDETYSINNLRVSGCSCCSVITE